MRPNSRLVELKKDLLTIRQHQNRIKQVPQLEIVEIFRARHERNKRHKCIREATRQIAKLQKAVLTIEQQIHRESKIYEQHSEVLKDKVYILKAFIKNLEMQYEQVKKEFSEVEFLKTLTAAIRRCCLYKLAEIFLNDQARVLYRNSLYLAIRANSQLRFPYQEIFAIQMEDEISICLAYMLYMVDMTARVININLLNPFIFRGIKSYIRSADRWDSYPLQITKSGDKKVFEQALKVCSANAAQILDTIGVDRKIKRQQDILSMFDMLSQYIILTEIDDLKILS